MIINNCSFTVNQVVNNGIDTHAFAHNTDECIIETTRNFQPFPAETININKELSKQNDILNKNLNTELQNESISNVVLSQYNLHVPLIRSNKDTGKNCINFAYIMIDMTKHFTIEYNLFSY